MGLVTAPSRLLPATSAPSLKRMSVGNPYTCVAQRNWHVGTRTYPDMPSCLILHAPTPPQALIAVLRRDHVNCLGTRMLAEKQSAVRTLYCSIKPLFASCSIFTTLMFGYSCE